MGIESMRKNWLLLIFFLFVGLWLLPNSSFAQEKAGFSVSPPSFEINALPGDTLDNTIKIENLSPFSLKIKAQPKNFIAYGEGGQVSLTEEGNSFSISKWIKLEDDEFNINPNDFALVNFKINIPKNAEPGSHYGAIVFSTVPDQKSKTSGAFLSQEIGSLILIKLPGDVFEDAKLLSFKPERQIFQTGNIRLLALVENTGNVHIKPYGSIYLTNIFGKKVKSIEVKGKNILPGSKRLFDEEFKLNSLGYYKTQITLIYAGGGKILKGETGFFVYDKKTLILYVIIGTSALIIYLILRKRINRALKVLIKG